MKPFFETSTTTLYQGDCLEVLGQLPEQSVHCCVTSPPYFGLRDYGVPGQLGLEDTPEEYVAKMVDVFHGVWRVLRDDGTCWINLGDSFGAVGGDTHSGFNERWSGTGGEGSKQNAMLDGVKDRKIKTGLRPKNLLGMPWRLAFALQAAGWYLRSDIVWSKPNPMPESVTDRPTKAHEYVFLLSKKPRYFWDADAVREEQTGDLRTRIPCVSKKMAGTIPGLDGSGNEQRMQAHQSHMPIPGGRNRRTVWTIPTQPYPSAHFATFPTALVEPCIMAGTSEKGACPECLTPWRRVVEKERVRTRPDLSSKYGPPEEDIRGGSETLRKRTVLQSTTVGWEPSCKCNAGEPIPCTVADIFCGSGTTLQVARWLGRHGIGIELSKEYCELAVKRIQQPRERTPVVAPLQGQMELF